jgi:hypothetical protein
MSFIFKAYSMSYLPFSLQKFLRRYRIPSHIFPIGFWRRLFKHDPHIITLLISKLIYEFSFSRFSHISHQWDSNLKCHIIFSLYFPIGFKGVLMAYTHRLISHQDFSHRDFGGVLHDNIQRWLKKNYIEIPISNWSRGSVMKYWIVIN